MSGPEKLNPEASSLAYRACLGQFATGVTVVTCCGSDGRPRGITANSFSSVSLQPPLVLWNIAKTSNSLQEYLNAKDFAIQILSDRQHKLAAHFARPDHAVFDDIEYRKSDSGVPLLPDCLATFECTTDQIHDTGDHHIIIGQVDRFSWDRTMPLLFFSGHYREIGVKID